MAVVPHWRISMIGRLGGAAGTEQFSMNLSMIDTDGSAFAEGRLPLEPNDAQWDNLAADCVAWFGHPDTAIHPDAVLTLIKVAPIGANGRYSGPPVERVVNQPGTAPGAGRPHNQDAYVVTLHTAGDLGRIKGRFYVQMPTWGVSTDGRIVAGAVDAAEARAKIFLEALNNEPGFDVLGLKVVVASAGRKNLDGSVRLGPGNHTVNGVSVGRVVDTQRRRRNKLGEGRTGHRRQPVTALRALTRHESAVLAALRPHTRLHAVELLRAVPDLRVTSGLRTPERNRAVGGVPGSWHLRGRAVDFAGSRVALAAGYAAARAQRVTPGCTGPEELLDEGDHLHVAW